MKERMMRNLLIAAVLVGLVAAPGLGAIEVVSRHENRAHMEVKDGVVDTVATARVRSFSAEYLKYEERAIADPVTPGDHVEYQVFLQFDASAMLALPSVTSAQLKLTTYTSQSRNDPFTLGVLDCSDNWDNTNLCWDLAYGGTMTLGTTVHDTYSYVPHPTVGTVISLDVTSYVESQRAAGDGIISLYLKVTDPIAPTDDVEPRTRQGFNFEANDEDGTPEAGEDNPPLLVIVPEPTTMLLFGVGAGLVSLKRRRR
jgi:hypothetical protein